MSKYTTELRYVCEVESGLVDSEGFNSIETILSKSRQKIFNFPYPIFDEAYRPVLETKILRHYYTRELCADTVGLWKHFLSVRLNQIMPYYNKLYESETLQFNPLRDTDLTKDHSGKGKKASEYDRTNSETHTNTRTDNLTKTDDYTRTDNLTETDTHTRTDNLSKVAQDSGTQGESGSDVNKNSRWDIYSDTPQGALTNVENETYLTNARKIVDDGTGSTHSNTTTFGKKVSETDTGTVQDSGTINNTGTQKNGGTTTNTGTQQNSGSLSSTIGSTEDISTTDEYIEHIVGKSSGASYSKLLMEYRETMINIDSLIIEDLSDLFFNLW